MSLCIHHFVRNQKQWSLLSSSKLDPNRRKKKNNNLKKNQKENYEDLVKTLISLITSQGRFEPVVISEFCFILGVIGIRTFPVQWPTFFIDLFRILNCFPFYEKQYLEPRVKQLGGNQMPEDYIAFKEQQTGENEYSIRSIYLILPEINFNALILPALKILTYLPEEINESGLIINRDHR